MKNIYTLLFVLSISPIVLKAQSNFKRGYIVDLKGDTVKGLVDYREWDNNPATVTFKGTGGTGTNYSAENIKAFEVTGFVKFISATLPISQQQVDVNLTSNKNADTAAIVKTVFLRNLTSGKVVSLYAYNDQIKSRFYVTEGVNKPIQELIYQIYYDENSTLKKITRYKVQLQYIANQNGATSVSSQIAGAGYTQTDLVKVIRAINGSTADATTTEAGTKGSRTFI
ncbi:MAG: hypothetical protein H7289_13500 [Mucilaginibacter sp.]|nr:hypothetical protein [Mucilaginibacter sp.]